MYTILSIFNKHFRSLSNELKLNYILCPIDAVRAKLANKYLSLLVETRNLVDKREPVSGVGILSLGVRGITVIQSSDEIV